MKAPLVRASLVQWRYTIYLVLPFYLIQVRYRKDPHMQNSMRKLKLTLTLVLTVTDTGGAVLTLMLGYRSLYITIHGNSGHLR